MSVLVWLFCLATLAQEPPEPGDETTVEPSDEPADEPADESVAPSPDAPGDAGDSGLPDGVEPGSVQETYTALEGESLDDIALKLTLLPRELRSWNPDLADTGEVGTGTKIVYWAAPLEVVDPDAEPEDDKKKKKKKKKDKDEEAGDADGDADDSNADDERTGVSPFVGLQFGPAFSFSPLKTAATPRLEAGIELPFLDRMFRVFVSGAYARPLNDGIAADVAHLPGSDAGEWTWELRQTEWQIAFGPTVRLTMLDLPIIPEASIGPEIYVLNSKINGEAGGAAFPESDEHYVNIGLYFNVGAALPIGPGEATLLLQLSGAGLKGMATPDEPDRTTITGQSSTTAFAPSLGYRLVF